MLFKPESDIVKKLIDRSEPIPMSGCWIWMGGTYTDGYGAVNFMGRTDRAHRVSYRVFKGAIPNELLVCHSCDQPLCVNPEHLFLGTYADNMADMRRKNRSPRGSSMNNTLINDDIAMSIFIASGSNVDIAKDFSVSKTTVWRIKAKKNWKHIHANSGAK